MAHISYQSSGVHGGSTVLTWTALSCHYSGAPKPSDSQWACLQPKPSIRHVGSKLGQHQAVLPYRSHNGAFHSKLVCGKSWERN